MIWNNQVGKQIYEFLDLKDILNLEQVSKIFFKDIQCNNLWKSFFKRDLMDYIASEEEQEESTYLKIRENNLQEILDQTIWRDLNLLKDEDFMIIKKEMFKDEKVKARLANYFSGEKNYRKEYKNFYLIKRKSISQKIFQGYFGAHGIEKIIFRNIGYRFIGVKITGDPNVPEGKITLDVNMNKNFTTGSGLIHLADTGYYNARWQLSKIQIINKSFIKAQWFYNLLSINQNNLDFFIQTVHLSLLQIDEPNELDEHQKQFLKDQQQIGISTLGIQPYKFQISI